MAGQDAISLTRSLLQFDTVNPPGRERDCAHMAGSLLKDWGFAVEFVEYAEGRTSVIARAGGSDARAPLCLTGHLDVVPLGTRKWSKDPFAGVSAHGSMPQLGVNAIYKAAKAIAQLEEFRFGVPEHPVMGLPTLNVGTFAGGSGINLVPDAATLGVDIRTVPGTDHDDLLSRLRSLLTEAELTVLADSQPVWTEPDEAWVQRVFAICQPILKEKPVARTAPYMTDAANLRKVYAGAPTVVLGPGEAAMAHQTDEYCNMERIRQSVQIYEAIIEDWCR